LETTVKYVSVSAIYLDAGRSQGIQKGDPGEIRRADSLIARVEVEFVADNSASCRLLESSGIIRVGDRAIVQITPPPKVETDTTSHQPVPAAPAPAPLRKPPKASINRVTGSASVQALSQNDLGQSNRDFVEPAFVLRGQLDNLAGTQHTLSVRLRSVKTDRQLGASQEWTHRLYEFALYYRNPDARISYGAGRLLSNRLSGIGYLDGATLEYRMNPVWSVGAFGGAQPDLRTFGFDKKQTKAGVFAAYDRGSFATSHLSGTLALAGNYQNSNISREFAYEQLSYSVQRLFLYQSAEANINRGWRKAAEGSSIDLSNVLLNARYSPLGWLTTTLSYDNRTNFRTYETRFTPDSVFDHALRQGWKLGANAKLPQRLYLLGEAGVRTKQNEGTETRTLTGGIGSYDLFRSGFQLDARFTTFQGRFSKGYQPTFSVSRDILHRGRAGVQLGSNRYTIEQLPGTVDNRWVRLNTDWYLSRHIYGSAYGEIDAPCPIAVDADNHAAARTPGATAAD